MSKLLNNINLQIKRNNCDQESKDVLKLYNALINNKLNSSMLFNELIRLYPDGKGYYNYQVKPAFINLIREW